uniref:Neuregulin 4 n=1 Tax=Equus asinus TaxID=9793 RepID=A0A9L0JND5_EQUAS
EQALTCVWTAHSSVCRCCREQWNRVTRDRGKPESKKQFLLCNLGEKTFPQGQIRCVENYTGARCEEIFLPSFSIRTKSDLFAAFVALAILLGTFIIGAIYFLCRNGHLQRANVVQYDINLVETNSTSAHHSHGEH